MNAIETFGLTRSYGRHEALHSLDLQVPEGSVYALLGSNGAGKSTTIKLLMNRLRPTAGNARVLGAPSITLGPRQFEKIGYVSESQQLPSWMTIRQFLDYCRPFYPAWDCTLEADLLSKLSLPEDRKIGDLSRGMRMKSALVSALAYRPSLLVLDEPFSGLDPLVRDEFTRGLLSVSAAEGCTVFISSHDIEDIERMVDHVAFLDEGRLKLSETAGVLMGRYRRVEVSGVQANAGPPPGAIDWENAGTFSRFTAPDYKEGISEAEWRKIYPGAEVATKAMTLREIVMAAIQTARDQREANS